MGKAPNWKDYITIPLWMLWQIIKSKFGGENNHANRIYQSRS